MKVRFISDLHLEFSAFPVQDEKVELCPSKREVLLVAGDTVLTQALKKDNSEHPSADLLRKRFDRFLDAAAYYKQVYMIGGNHEAYSYGDVAENKNIIVHYLKKRGLDNVHYLENARVPLKRGVDLLACTLWTSMKNRDPNVMWKVGRRMNDFRVSNYNGNVFTPDDAASLHEKSLTWLARELLDTSKKFVVMTHHCPSFQSINPIYKGDDVNYGYASDLDGFISSHPHVKFWIHGHTHHNVDYMIGKTRVLAHQRGYPNDYERGNWKGFKAEKFVEI